MDSGRDAGDLEGMEAAAPEIGFVEAAEDDDAGETPEGAEVEFLEEAFLEVAAKEPAVDGGDEGKARAGVGSGGGMPVGLVAGGVKNGRRRGIHGFADLADESRRPSAPDGELNEGDKGTQGIREGAWGVAEAQFLHQDCLDAGAGGFQARKQVQGCLFGAIERARILKKKDDIHGEEGSVKAGEEQIRRTIRRNSGTAAGGFLA